MLLVTTALSGLMAGAIQTAPTPTAPPPPQQPPQQHPVPAATPQPEPETPVPTATAEETEGAVDLGTVNVAGSRPRGSVDSDIPPDLVLSAEEIQAYGASSISELLTYLEPVTRSSRGSGQPVMLVNGRRISGFREIQGLPPEAIERVDILPEEVALEYGYRADQRVVNFVLKSNFRSVTTQVEGRVPTAGGRTTTGVDANILRISGAQRWSMELEYDRATPLFESERDLIREAGSTPFDLIGNVTSDDYSPGCLEADPATCTAIDPALGTAITPVPGGISNPALADFVAAAGAPRTGDLGAYRTLMSATESSEIGGTIKNDLNGTTQITFSGSLEDNSSRSFNGLPGVVLTLPDTNAFSPFADDVLVYRYIDDAAALGRQTDSLTASAGVLLDGFLGESWRWTWAGNYDRVETDTVTGRGYDEAPFQTRLAADDPTANPFAPLAPADFTLTPNDTANSVSEVLSTEVVLNGDIWDLPAGGVSSTIKFGADTRSLDSVSVRSGVTTERSQSRDRYNGQASFNIPIASTRAEVLPLLGDMSLNLNFGYEDLSDFGGLRSVGAGLNWTPVEQVSFLFSYTDEQGAPSIGQLNDPVISTPNVPVFDFRTGQTVFVSRTEGGNPDLDAENRRIWKAGVTLQPLKDEDLRISSTWTRNAVEDSINSFPTITPDLEAALPGRFTREPPTPDDPIGRLVSIDARPLNFALAEREDIRTGFNFSKAFGTPTPQSAGGAGAQGGPRPGGGPVIIRGGDGDGPRGDRGGERRGGGDGPTIRMGGGPGGPGGRGGMQPGQGRFMVSIYHTYRIQDEILIADGLPVLDLLDGAATSGRGGSPRHELSGQLGVFKNGMGAFVNANWRDGTRIDGGAGPDLNFSDLTTVNLNVFVDLGAQTSWVEKYPWLKGARLQIGVRNLFDSRTEVTSSAGDTPLNYQPDYLDPEGRSIGISLRKILF